MSARTKNACEQDKLDNRYMQLPSSLHSPEELMKAPSEATCSVVKSILKTQAIQMLDNSYSTSVLLLLIPHGWNL